MNVFECDSVCECLCQRIPHSSTSGSVSNVFGRGCDWAAGRLQKTQRVVVERERESAKPNKSPFLLSIVTTLLHQCTVRGWTGVDNRSQGGSR